MTSKINYTANIDKVGLRPLQEDKKSWSLSLISHETMRHSYLQIHPPQHKRRQLMLVDPPPSLFLPPRNPDQKNIFLINKLYRHCHNCNFHWFLFQFHYNSRHGNPGDPLFQYLSDKLKSVRQNLKENVFLLADQKEDLSQGTC